MGYSGKVERDPLVNVADADVVRVYGGSGSVSRKVTVWSPSAAAGESK
jgi:hypothetical protein